jgi:hypothetical protein
MNARGTAGRLAVGLASLALVAGCASGASPTPVPATPTPIVTPSAAVATPTLAPTPTASAAGPMTFGPVTVVTGTESCPGLNPDWTQDPNGTWQVRDLTVECVDSTDDPRVSGTHTATWNMDVWGALDQGAGAGVQWGTVRLDNAGGAWEGQLSGVASLPGRGDIIAIWYKGTSGYAGLAYFELVTGSPPTWKIQGQVFPGDPPPPYAEGGTTITRPETGGPVADDAVAVVTGTADCPGLDFTFTIDPDGTQHVRDDYHADRCTLTTDDPRVTGVRSSTWNMDVWGNVNAGRWGLVQWGTPRLENEGGAWEGRATGVASSSHGDIIVNWYKGTGDYAGLGYFELWTGSGPWKIQGQIFPGDPPTP